jgi:deaminated glutathione amidase
MIVSCLQFCSDKDSKKNYQLTKKLFLKALKKGADLIITPENSSVFGLTKKEIIKNGLSMKKDYYVQKIRILAKKYKKWILIGSAIVKEKKKIRNRSILISPKGNIHTYYDKIHMYDAKLSKKEKYIESKIYSAGNLLKIAKLPWGKLGLTICYDVRFPMMYRKLSKKGVLFISIPSAFTKTTGKKHWHSLLRSRAIENFCYIFASAQQGQHWNGRQTYGHSIIISPDGKILSQLKKGNGIISAKINPKYPKILRRQIPSLKND